MWRNWNPLNPPINEQSSDDDQNNYESAGENDPDNLVSPNRPHQSPSASPRALLRPDPPRVQDVLEEVGQQLRALPSREERAANRNAVRAAAEAASREPEVVEGHVVGEPDLNKLQDNNIAEMPDVVAFEDEDGVDDNRALQEARSALARFEWDENDIHFSFNKIEIEMTAVGVKKNYTKFQVLSTVIPKKIIDEVKPLLRRKETEFPNKNAYRLLKDEILRIFGPKPSAAVDRALGRVLTGKPSTLARALVNDLCKKQLDCECCPGIVLALWRRHLPDHVRSGIAHCKFNKNTFDEVLELADDIFESRSAVSTVAAVAKAGQVGQLDETLPAIPYATAEVSAVSRGRGGGRGRGRGRGNRGGNRGGGGQNQNQNNQASSSGPKHKGTKHPDLPAGDWQGCSMHFRWGRGAFFCSEPATCPWKNVYTTKPTK